MIHCVLLDRYDRIGERVCPEEDNEKTGAQHFSCDQRVFSAPGLEIDLSDVGPRGEMPK